MYVGAKIENDKSNKKTGMKVQRDRIIFRGIPRKGKKPQEFTTSKKSLYQ